MYGIRKFINHINKTIDIVVGCYQIDIQVSKHRYVINDIDSEIRIYANYNDINDMYYEQSYYGVSDHVTKHKKKYYYTYEPNMIKMWVNHSDKMVMIIDNCILIIRYDDDSHPINYIVINMKGEAFIFQQ